jgi:peptide/nickel transport system ATP-binding protein
MYAGKIAELGTNEQIFGAKGPMHPYTQKLLQATPLLRKKVDSLAFIPGTPPDLVNPPTGCRFNPRCHCTMDKCFTDEPPLIEIEPGHQVACWRCVK